MHHSPFGSRGALWGSRNGTVSSFPQAGLSFKKHILPILMSRCASCHLPGATTTRLVMKSDIDFQYPDPQSTQIDFSKAHDLTAYNDQAVTVGAQYGQNMEQVIMPQAIAQTLIRAHYCLSPK